MNENKTQSNESALSNNRGSGEDQFGGTHLYLTRRPARTTRADAAVDWQHHTYDARVRLARMLYPYEYWSQPTHQGDDRCTVMSGLTGDDVPPMQQAPVGMLAAAAGFLWLLATRGIRAGARGLSSLASRQVPD